MRRPPLMATVATLICIALLCGLGTWQVKRLHWKEGLLAQLDSVYRDKNPPILDYNGLLRQARAGDEFTAARLKGRFTGKPLLLGVRTWQGNPGYHMIAALDIPGGAVLVNRGWVPDGAPPPALPRGTVTVRGVLHRPGHDNPFVPQNNPAAGEWYRWNLAQMAHATGVPQLAPVVMYEQDESGKTADTPVTAALRWDLPNNHRGYAIFWFSMAGALAVIYFLRFVKAKPA